MMKKCKSFGRNVRIGCADARAFRPLETASRASERPGARLEYNNGAGVAMAAHLDAFHAAEVSWTPST
jgi:hypothetical protein